MVWGSIDMQEKSDLVFIEGNMTAARYINGFHAGQC